MRYLIVIAHPDDEALGAGASIHKWAREGNEVAVAILSGHAAARINRSDTLAEDEQKAMAILGIKQSYHAQFPNIKMNTVPHLELVQFIESCIEDWHAEVIVTHHPTDTNNDHVMVSGAAQAACRMFQRRPGMTPLKELMYMEVLSSTEWSLAPAADRFVPNTFVEVGKEGMDVKLEALKAYHGVMRPYPHPRSEEAILGLAAYRGAQAGRMYVEAFESVFRSI